MTATVNEFIQACPLPISRSAVYRYLKTGALVGKKAGRAWLIDVDSVFPRYQPAHARAACVAKFKANLRRARQ